MSHFTSKSFALFICVLCIFAFLVEACGEPQIHSTPALITPTPVVSPGCDRGSPAGQQTDGPTISGSANQDLGFQIRLPLSIPHNMTWDSAYVLPSNAKAYKADYYIVPLFHAQYGMWTAVGEPGAYTIQDSFALDETTGAMTPTIALSVGTSPLTVHDQSNITIGKDAGTLLHLVPTEDGSDIRVTELLWKVGSVTLRMTAIINGDLAFTNVVHTDISQRSITHTWSRGDDRTLLQIAHSVTVYAGCGT